jgi:hypothetical protein
VLQGGDLQASSTAADATPPEIQPKPVSTISNSAHKVSSMCQICKRQFKDMHAFQVHTAAKHNNSELQDGNMQVTINNSSITTTDADATATPQDFGWTDQSHLGRDLQKELKNMRKRYINSATEKQEQVDALYDRLKAYHDNLAEIAENVVTLKLSPEALDVIREPCKTDDPNRNLSRSESDQSRLSALTAVTKDLKLREKWYWRHDGTYYRREYNERRLQFCVEKELVERVIICPHCKSTGLLIGLDQIDSSVCYECTSMNTGDKRQFMDAWDKVQSASENFPKRTEEGHQHEDLPTVNPGEKAVIAPVQPVVTVRKNRYSNRVL